MIRNPQTCKWQMAQNMQIANPILVITFTPTPNYLAMPRGPMQDPTGVEGFHDATEEGSKANFLHPILPPPTYLSQGAFHNPPLDVGLLQPPGSTQS